MTTGVSFFGYDDCVRLENESTRVTLGLHGGRVLEYSLHDVNAIYLGGHPMFADQEGWKWRPGENDGGPKGGPVGGRMDIGPEMLNPARPALWLGAWTAVVLGPRSVLLTSPECAATGVVLKRLHTLAEVGSRLSVTQTICNVSTSAKRYFHWSRTFAHSGGKVLIPLTEDSRYPSKYIQYGPGGLLTTPIDPAITERDGFLCVPSPPPPSPLSPFLEFDLTQRSWGTERSRPPPLTPSSVSTPSPAGSPT